jgi:hypothetical protein
MKREIFTAEVTSAQAQILHRVLALMEELNHLADTAPDGCVFDTCEASVLCGGRQVQQQLLQQAVQRRIESAEKKGRRSACASADGPKKTAVRRRVDS